MFKRLREFADCKPEWYNSNWTVHRPYRKWKTSEMEREKERVQMCVWRVECRGLAESFYHWTAASAPLASKSRGGGGEWFQLIAPVPNSTGLLKPTLLHCLFFSFSLPVGAKSTPLCLYFWPTFSCRLSLIKQKAQRLHNQSWLKKRKRKTPCIKPFFFLSSFFNWENSWLINKHIMIANVTGLSVTRHEKI